MAFIYYGNKTEQARTNAWDDDKAPLLIDRDWKRTCPNLSLGHMCSCFQLLLPM